MSPAVVLLAATLSQASRGMPTSHTTHSMNHYDLDLPAGYAVKDITPPLADFELYEISGSRAGARLGLYFGNHPQFPKYEWAGPPRSESKKGRTSQQYPYSSKERRMEGRIMFDGLSYKTTAHSPYTYAHYFATDVNADEARIFEEIVRSIRVARPHLD